MRSRSELETAIERWRSAEALHVVGRWREDPDATPLSVVDDHAWLGSAEAHQAVHDLSDLGALDSMDRDRAMAHLHAFERDALLAPLWSSLEKGSRLEKESHLKNGSRLESGSRLGNGHRQKHSGTSETVNSSVPSNLELFGESAPWWLSCQAHLVHGREEEVARAIAELRVQADERLREGISIEEVSRLAELAEEVLNHTQDGAESFVGWLECRDRSEDELRKRLATECRAPLFPRTERWRQLSRFVQNLGYDRELDSHVRVEPYSSGPLPLGTPVAVRVPNGIKLPECGSLGLISQQRAARAFGHGLALALISVGTPPLHRRPVVASMALTMGSLVAQVACDPRVLLAERRLTRSEAEHASRYARGLHLLGIRVAAAMVIARSDAQPSRDAATHNLMRALCAEVAPDSAWLMMEAWCCSTAPRGPFDHFGALLAGYAGYWGLRERHDEDWHRNPRTGPLLRGCCAQGDAASANTLLEELGSAALLPEAALSRLAELWA